MCMTSHSAPGEATRVSRPRRRPLAFVAMMLTVTGLLACSPSSQPSPIFGYRLIDDRTLSVQASTDTGFETWVASVDQTPAAVVVSVRTRATGFGAGAPVARDLWLTVKLDAPLGGRRVVDAIGDTPVGLVP